MKHGALPCLLFACALLFAACGEESTAPRASGAGGGGAPNSAGTDNVAGADGARDGEGAAGVPGLGGSTSSTGGAVEAEGGSAGAASGSGGAAGNIAAAGRAVDGDPFASPSHCSSGAFWDPNESEGLDMMPGHTCNACHALSNAASGENDAPIFAFAGTVYASGHEPDDCSGSGSEGAHVVVTDAAGAVFTAEVGHTGNFSFEDEAFRYPLRAKVVFQGRERAMLSEQMSGDCNRCHSEGGQEAAPGRIALP